MSRSWKVMKTYWEALIFSFTGGEEMLKRVNMDSIEKHKRVVYEEREMA